MQWYIPFSSTFQVVSMDLVSMVVNNEEPTEVILVITWLIVIDIAPLTVLFCNYPLLKDISFNTKCLLVLCDLPVITCLVRTIFGIYHPRDF